jgi:hypothetical protein
MDIDIYKSFVYSKKGSLSKELCDQIIIIHNNDETKKDGSTLGGVNKNIKDTTDIVINFDSNIYIELQEILKTELMNTLPQYINSFPNIQKYSDFFDCNFFIDMFIIQKYDKNKGKYIYHNDSKIDYKNKKYRMFTFIWYLNDVYEGGETEFINFKIIPEKGKLLIFPATFVFPHCGNIPISNDKYILTGWIYSSHFEKFS